MMKKRVFCAMLLAMTLLGLSALPASAANHPTPDVRYVLTPSASSVAVGGVVTVTFSVERTDGGGAYTVNAMENYVEYDNTAWQYVSGSAKVSVGGYANLEPRTLVSGEERIHAADISAAYGSRTVFGSFQLRALKAGNTVLRSVDSELYTSEEYTDSPLESIVKSTPALSVTVTNGTQPNRTPITGGGSSSNTGVSGSSSSGSPGISSVRPTTPATSGGSAVPEAPVTPTAPSPAASAISFSDVRTTDYFKGAVDWAVANRVTGGVALGQFSPHSECTRAQCVAFLWRAAGRPEPSSGLGAFSDVPSGAYYEKAVAWAVEQGITLGTAKHQFSPDKPVSRAQAVTFLYRAGKANEQGAQTEFNDVPNDAYYAQAVLWALNNRITDGVAKRTFAPGAICDRAQIVTFLYRCYS